MKKIAVFASGEGTNASNIIKHFSTGKNAEVVTLFTNNPHAGVIKRVKAMDIPVFIFDRDDFYYSDRIIDQLILHDIDFIALAGFLWYVPVNIISLYRGRIVNIHPALLPCFGGRGMYGDKVHRAVLDAGSKVTGITIHHVNENYDEGDIIFRAECEVRDNDTVETLAARVHELEYRHYPAVIELLLANAASH